MKTKFINLMCENRNYYNYVLLLLLVSTILLMVGAFYYENYNLAMVSVYIVLLTNIAYSIRKFKERFIFLFFNFTFFLFIVAHPLMYFLKGTYWYDYYGSENNVFIVISMYLSLLFLQLGMRLYDICIKGKGFNKKYEKKRDLYTYFRKENLKKVISILLIISTICYFYREFDKFIFMQGKDYASFYSLYKSDIPFVIDIFAEFYSFSVAAYLALLPSKKEANIVLALYFLSSIPILIIGQRNPIMLNALFILMYYLIRNFKDKQENWIGFVEKAVIVILIPVSILGMSIINYTRDDQKVSLSPVQLVGDFLEKQSTTFSTIEQGFMFQDNLPKHKFRNYTFGSIIDYIQYGQIGRLIFNNEDLGDGNNIKKALKGNNFAHHISYVVEGKEYLTGHGRGSSYLIENFIDFGYLGICIFSFIIGLLMYGIYDMFGKNWLLSTCILIILSKVMFLPRDTSTNFIQFIFTYHFWIVIILILIFTYFVSKIKECMYEIK